MPTCARPGCRGSVLIEDREPKCMLCSRSGDEVTFGLVLGGVRGGSHIWAEAWSEEMYVQELQGLTGSQERDRTLEGPARPA